MTTVELITFTSLKRIIGKKRIIIDAGNIIELLENLVKKYGKMIDAELFEENGELKKIYRIVVNGRNINLLEGFQTKLKDEDIIAIMPAIAGG